VKARVLIVEEGKLKYGLNLVGNGDVGMNI
jgi:hypothetical protein